MSGTDIIVTPLTATEKKVLEQVSLGREVAAGASVLGMKPGTFSGHSGRIGLKLQVKGPAVKVQMGFVAGYLCLPEPIPLPEEFSDAERRVWEAVALHGVAGDIARAAGVDQFDLPAAVADLMGKAGAVNVAHLVRLGHAFGILSKDATPPPTVA
ncbi:hypothetical protein CTZ27_29650 [Streptomyces griseocarneus]|nr:hypothetical protein CTZ27_29650 [Streptomyces griseocarneus]